MSTQYWLEWYSFVLIGCSTMLIHNLRWLSIASSAPVDKLVNNTLLGPSSASWYLGTRITTWVLVDITSMWNWVNFYPSWTIDSPLTMSIHHWFTIEFTNELDSSIHHWFTTYNHQRSISFGAPSLWGASLTKHHRLLVGSAQDVSWKIWMTRASSQRECLRVGTGQPCAGIRMVKWWLIMR